MFLYPYIFVVFLLVYFLLFTSDFAAEPHFRYPNLTILPVVRNIQK